MSKIHKFDNFDKTNENEEKPKIKVKDIIEYFNSLDPEMEVSLDKDGWDYQDTPQETIKNTYLFDVWDFRGVKRLTINN